MKNGKNRTISFGITLTSDKRTRSQNSDRGRRMATDRRQNVIPAKPEQMSLHEFDFPLMKMPPREKLPPFTPDMFISEPVPLPTFPPPRKLSGKEERVHRELERFHARAEWHPAPGKSSSTAAAVSWELFKIICIGVFVALKYAFVAVAVVITVGCMICAGRQTSGLR